MKVRQVIQALCEFASLADDKTEKEILLEAVYYLNQYQLLQSDDAPIGEYECECYGD